MRPPSGPVRLWGLRVGSIGARFSKFPADDNFYPIGCSPIVFESQRSPKRSSRRRNISKNQCISDSEESHDVQEERRAEFEKFRNQKKLKRKPQFAIGQPLSNDNLKISALFPRLEGQDQAGRHVPTIDGDQVFIPKLNLDDQWSIEDHVKSLDSIKVSDKSCQAEEEVPQILPKPRKTKRKSKVSNMFLK